MRLPKSCVGGTGLRRVRRGRRFSCLDEQEEPLRHGDVLDRGRIPGHSPAWKDVWICPYPNGHIQAVGTDAAGRRQYLYHAQWQAERAEEKYERVLGRARQLPDWRAQTLADLRGRGLQRDRVLAVAQLIDRGYFHAGGEEYAEENGSFGLANPAARPRSGAP